MAWYNEQLTHGYSTGVSGLDTPHFARDYQTGFHEMITSLISGKVVKADYTPWGGEVFVHPDIPNAPVDFYVYHLDVNKVRTGQHVNVGDVIGLAGGENPGYPGAQHPTDPKYSTGLHTHAGLIYADPKTGDPSKGFMKVPEYEDVAGHMHPNYTLPEGPDVGALLDWYREGQTGPAPAALVLNPPSSMGIDPSSGKVDPGANYAAPKTDSDGCIVPINWTDTVALNDYLNCKMGVGGGYLVRGLWMVFGIILVVTGVKMMARPPIEEGGQAQGGGGGQPSLVKDVGRAAVTGAASAVGGLAGEAAAKKIASKFRKTPAPTKVP